MIKSIISKFTKRYLTNVNSENICYNIFTQTVDLYNVSINPEFFLNVESKIGHLTYKFTFSKKTITIRDVFLKINDTNFPNNSTDNSQVLEIFNITVIYKDYKITICEIIDNVIRGVRVFYKENEIASMSKIYKKSCGFFIKKICLNFFKLDTSILNSTKDDSISFLKFKIYIKKTKIVKGHLYLKKVFISKADNFMCKIKQIKHSVISLDNIVICLEDRFTLSNDLMYLDYFKGTLNLKVFKSLPLKYSSECSKSFDMKILQDFLHLCPPLNLNVVYLDIIFSMKLDKHLYDVKVNNIATIERIEFKKDIYIKNVIYKNYKKESIDVCNDVFLINALNSINCNIIVYSFSTDQIFIKQIIYESQAIFNLIKTDNDDITHENSIDLVKIKLENNKLCIDLDNIKITNVLSIMSLFQAEASQLQFHINVRNLRVFYEELEFIFKSVLFTNNEIFCFLDVLVSNQYFIDNCQISKVKNIFRIDRLFVNISDNIIHNIFNSNLLVFKNIFLNDNMTEYKAISVSLDSIYINFFNTSNEEIFSVYLSEIDLFKSVYNLSLNIKSAQIDNQEYFSSYPIIFKSLTDNFCTLNVANKECYISVGKFNLYFEDLIGKVNFLMKFINLSGGVPLNFDFDAFHINDINCNIFYKYFIDLKIENTIIKKVSGTLSTIIDKLCKTYRTKINKKLIGLIFKNIKNNIYTKPVWLGYIDDINLPVPWYIRNNNESRIKYPMPMRGILEKYDLGLCSANYIFNKLENKYSNEVFKDGSFCNIFYKKKLKKDSNENICLILTNKRLIMSTKLNIKDICIEEISIRENSNYFIIGEIKIEVMRQSFILSLCKYILNL